ncbi:MAG: CAP domain-containing protein [Solirubrobacterales bacterium]
MRRVLAAVLVLAVAATAAAPAQSPARGLIASASTCPSRGAGATAQERQMLCFTNYARRAAGRPPLGASAPLHRAAVHKSADILRCDEFSHEACGRDFTYWVQQFTSCGAIAENIAWGTGPLGGVRAIFRAWMHSSGHRENILGPYAQIGIGLRSGSLEDNAGTRVWTQDFGAGC